MIVMTVFGLMSLQKLPTIHEKYEIAQEIENSVWAADISAEKEVVPQTVVQDDATIDSQIEIELPADASDSDTLVGVDYLTQTVSIKMTTAEEDFFSNYSISGSSDHIASLKYYRQDDCGVIAFTTDMVYEISYQIEDGFIYLDFVDPHEIYDKVVVVDAGHGSRVVGAVKNNICEKDINLSILLYLKECFDNYDGNIGVYYTKTEDINPTLQQRVNLANKANADLFISIHNNSSGNGNYSSVHGTQVLYSESDDRELGSKRLAQICLDNVTSQLSSKSVGLLAGDDIYIIRSSDAPVALVEVGFMTNREELSELSSEEYQRQAAQGIFNAVIQAFEEGY